MDTNLPGVVSETPKPIQVVEAGVDPAHQTDHCNMKTLDSDDLIKTTGHTGPPSHFVKRATTKLEILFARHGGIRR